MIARRVKIVLFFVLACLGRHVPYAQADFLTRFTIVESSIEHYVARGLQDYTVSPELGWTFTPEPFIDVTKAVRFDIIGPPLPGTTIDRWFLYFAAPLGGTLVPGIYDNFQKFPLLDQTHAAIGFESDNSLGYGSTSGKLEILEANFGNNGEVLSFAANFTHYGDGRTEDFAVVEFRYQNKSVNAVPVPSTLGLLASASVCLVVVNAWRRRAKTRSASIEAAGSF